MTHSPAPRPAELPRRRLLATGARAAAAVLAVAGTGACGLAHSTSASQSLPTPSPAEARRDALARRAALIASTAQVVAGTDASATAAGTAAQTQLDALGGVWEPWATAVPTSYPTASPVASAAADATAADLVVALADGADQARTACGEETGDAAARLYASLAVAWSLEALLLDSGAVSAADRDAAAMTAPLPGQTLLAYDAVRYAMEVIAARAADATRTSATADAATAKAIVNASVALGGTDTRLAAYAPPSEADADASADTTWARRVWTAVVDAEIAGVGSAGGAASTAAVDAALGAAVHARAWGAPVDDALPGL